MMQSSSSCLSRQTLVQKHILSLICFKTLKHGLLLSVCLLCMSFTAEAQVNVEQSRGQAHEGFNLSLDGSLTLIRGNVSLSQTGLGTKLNYSKGIHSPFVQAILNYGEKDGTAFLNQAYVHTRWTAMWFKSWGTELFAQAQEDSFRSLILRQLYGGGLRAELLGHSNQSLALGVGAMYEREVYQEEQANMAVGSVNPTAVFKQVTENNLRLTNYISLKQNLQWATELQLSATVYYQPRSDMPKDYRILADLGIEIKLSKFLRIVESLSVMYDSEPPEDVRNTDLKSLSSLRLVF